MIAGTGFQEPLVTSVLFPLLVATFALSVSLTTGPLWRALTNRPIRKLGDISYGIYLYHLLAISFAAATLGFATGDFADFLLYAAFALPVSVLLGWLSLRSGGAAGAQVGPPGSRASRAAPRRQRRRHQQHQWLQRHPVAEVAVVDEAVEEHRGPEHRQRAARDAVAPQRAPEQHDRDHVAASSA